jgi:hypothetical protein
MFSQVQDMQDFCSTISGLDSRSMSAGKGGSGISAPSPQPNRSNTSLNPTPDVPCRSAPWGIPMWFLSCSRRIRNPRRNPRSLACFRGISGSNGPSLGCGSYHAAVRTPDLTGLSPNIVSCRLSPSQLPSPPAANEPRACRLSPAERTRPHKFSRLQLATWH